MKIKKKEVPSEIFTGSMADISFLLIIYFMITSAFSATRGLDFALPEDTQTPEIKQGLPAIALRLVGTKPHRLLPADAHSRPDNH